MSEQRQRTDAAKVVEQLRQGIVDDRLLHLSDEELRQELMAPRREPSKAEPAVERAS
jgi:hypothetical protein